MLAAENRVLLPDATFVVVMAAQWSSTQAMTDLTVLLQPTLCCGAYQAPSPSDKPCDRLVPPVSSVPVPRLNCISTQDVRRLARAAPQPAPAARIAACCPVHWPTHCLLPHSTYCATAWSCSASPQARVTPLTCAVPTTATTALTPGSGSYRPSPSAGGLTPAAGFEGVGW